ncbi:MAG: TetR/AcrR family transcriptional regulator [Chloroflexota bacterium]
MAILYHIKNDQRSLRSAKTIYKALERLINNQPFDSIKVSELVKEADVGRATFYRNFDSIEDVLRWRCDQVVDQLAKYVDEYRSSQKGGVFMPLLKPVFRFFYLHSSIVELLIAANRIDILQMALQNKLEANAQNPPTLNPPNQYVAYERIMHTSAAVNILAHWVQTGKKEAPDELADGLNGIFVETMRARVRA